MREGETEREREREAERERERERLRESARASKRERELVNTTSVFSRWQKPGRAQLLRHSVLWEDPAQ